ncbi:MAG: hypothetical protein ACRBM6_31245 [Geminicoccales bacterium]
MYLVGTDYRYLYANNRVIDVKGRSAEETIGRHVVGLPPPLSTPQRGSDSAKQISLWMRDHGKHEHKCNQMYHA